MSATRVLIVDDESEALLEMAEGLGDFDLNCLVASNASVAITMLKQEKSIGAVITDFRMPRGNGVELLRAARDQGLLDGKKIFLVSGYLDDAISAQLDDLQLDIAMFPKPLDIEEIAGIVQTALRS
ncbi:MAG: response regulator [Alphaproteobacteria bacterium]